jgi:phospholipid/cholesterol/gamma-HCH transport system permease protein
MTLVRILSAPWAALRDVMLVLLEKLGRITGFVGVALRGLGSPPFFLNQVPVLALELVGRCSMPVISVLIGLGVAISIQAGSVFQLFSAEPLLGGVTGLMMFRELGPVISAILIAAQGGTSTATEIGAMRIKEEIDALELMAVDPMRMLILPRVLAFMIATPLLNFMACIAGMAGGYAAAMAQNLVSSGTYNASFFQYMTMLDLVNGIYKTTVFGFIIGCLSTYYGYYASGGAEGVGRSANQAVVQSIIVVLGANYFLTTAFFGAVKVF